VPSLAHPGTVVGLDELVPKLAAAGLAGIEAYYGAHSPEMTARCLALASEHDLVPTGGSDFHGRGDHGVDLGGVFVPPETIGRLESRRRGRLE
jgi:predicted metal-dependent phosphoesterase TrpH